MHDRRDSNAAYGRNLSERDPWAETIGDPKWDAAIAEGNARKARATHVETTISVTVGDEPPSR